VSFIMPGRRTTTNLIQASGELWDDEEQEAPLRFAILAGGPATEPRVAAVIRTVLRLAPDDVSLEPVSVEELPPFDLVAPDGVIAAPVERFQDDLATADGFVLIAPADDEIAIETIVRALRWAATPAGEDALTGLPVVWLGIGGDGEMAEATRSRIAAAVEAGGGTLLDPSGLLTAPLAGDWSGRLGPGAELSHLATRQAIGQVLIRLREVAFTAAPAAAVADADEDPAGA
jgi:hypothetical protein